MRGSLGKLDSRRVPLTRIAKGDPTSPRKRGEVNNRHALPRQLPARFSAKEARPSEASAVWRLAACMRTRRA